MVARVRLPLHERRHGRVPGDSLEFEQRDRATGGTAQSRQGRSGRNRRSLDGGQQPRDGSVRVRLPSGYRLNRSRLLHPSSIHYLPLFSSADDEAAGQARG